MILPIIASLSRDLFLTVPQDLKDGAEALGATRWEVIRGVVLPTTASGVAAAMVLGLGRALGEAIAVAQVVGNLTQIKSSLFLPGSTLASRIALDFPSPDNKLHVAAIFYLALVLLAINLISEPAGTGDRQTLRRRDWHSHDDHVGTHRARRRAGDRLDRSAHGDRQSPPARARQPRSLRDRLRCRAARRRDARHRRDRGHRPRRVSAEPLVRVQQSDRPGRRRHLQRADRHDPDRRASALWSRSRSVCSPAST